MQIFIGILIGLFTLMFLVTAHEFGHFIAARRNGVRVLEFGICFPPRLAAWVKDPETNKWKKLPRSEWGKPQEGLIFSLNLLPIGGFCQMDGESAADTRKHTFGASSFWSKTKILFGGVAMNWLVAFIILTTLAWTGMPTFLENQFTIDADTRSEGGIVSIEQVQENSPGEKAGLLAGDIIESIDDQTFYSAAQVADYNKSHSEQEMIYKVKRTETVEHIVQCIKAPCPPIESEEEVEKTITVAPTKDNNGIVGIALKSNSLRNYSTWSAPLVGAGLTLQLTGETFKGVGQLIGNLFSGVFKQLSFNDQAREEGREALSEASDSVSGPVGIIGQIFPMFASAGAANIAFLAAVISISLACMNVLPIPALDGGRWLLIAIYKLRKKPLSKETEEKIVARAFMVLLGLIALITIIDVTRFFK